MLSIKHSPGVSNLIVSIAVVCLLLGMSAMSRSHASDIFFDAHTIIIHTVTCSAKGFKGDLSCINLLEKGLIASQCTNSHSLYVNKTNLPRLILPLETASNVTSDPTSSFIQFKLLLPAVPRGKEESLLHFTCEYLSNSRNERRPALVSRSVMLQLACHVNNHDNTDLGAASRYVRDNTSLTCHRNHHYEACDDRDEIQDIAILPNGAMHSERNVTGAWAWDITSLPQGEQGRTYTCQVKFPRTHCQKMLTCRAGYAQSFGSRAEIFQEEEQNVTPVWVMILMPFATFVLGFAAGKSFEWCRRKARCSRRRAGSDRRSNSENGDAEAETSNFV